MTMTEINPFTQGQVLWTEHSEFINKTANSISRSYAKVEAEDVLQEIYIFLWEKEHYFLEQQRSDAYVRTCIKNVGINYALRQRDTTLLETDTFYYSFDDVRDLLPAFFAGDWNATKVVESTHQQYDSRDSLAMMCDFSMAFSALNDAQKDILNRKYGQDEELTESKDRQAASRALKKFTLTLNTATDKRAKAHEIGRAHV